MKKIAHIIILAFALAGAAMAQTVVTRSESNFSLTGTQTTPGSFNSTAQQITGNTFIVTGSGENYSFAHLTITFAFEGDPAEVETSTVTGGTWTLGLYQDSVYVGSIYGDIPSGEIAWTKDGDTGEVTYRTTEAQLRITGGTDAFAEGDYPAEPEQMGFFNSKTRFAEGSSVTKVSAGNLMF